MHLADFVALAAYFVTIALLGLWAARRVGGDVAGFVLPRRFGKTLMVFFGFGSGTHSDQAVSVAAKSFTNGVSGIWYQWLWLFVSPFYWWIAPMMRRFRALTTADVFEARYGRSVAFLFAVVGTAQYVVNIGVMLMGSAQVLDAATDGALPASQAIAGMTVLFVVYGIAGGLRAAIWTDFIQGILTVVFSFLLLPCVLSRVGGIEGIRESLGERAEGLFSLVAPSEIGLFYVAMLAINALVGIVTQPHVMANCAAGRSELDGQVGFMGGNLLKRVCTIAWCLTGFAAIVYFQGQELAPDLVFGSLAREFLPAVMPGLLGLFVAGLLAAVMSTCDTYMVTSAGLWTHNLYRPLFPGRREAHYLAVARVASLLIVACGVWFAYSLGSVLDGLVIFWKVQAMLGIAFWMGVFWRRATTAGAWASVLAAAGTWWVTSTEAFVGWVRDWPGGARLGLLFEGEIHLPWQMLLYLSAGLVTGVVTSLLTRPGDPRRLERFFELLRTPVVKGEPQAAPCSLPPGVEPAPARRLVAIPGLEIPRPSAQALAGFTAGWVAVGLLVGVFVWIVSG